MSMSEELEYLCDILIWQNNAICKSISKGGFNQLELYKYFKEKAREKLVKKTLSHGSLPAEPHDSLPVEPKKSLKNAPEHRLSKQERRDQYENKEHEKLIARIEKIKEKRQQDIENDKKWSRMNDKNDEIISRLDRLKPVEPVVELDPDIEYMGKMEELERERDKYFEEKDYFDKMDEKERVEYLDEIDRLKRAKYLGKRAKIKKRRNK